MMKVELSRVDRMRRLIFIAARHSVKVALGESAADIDCLVPDVFACRWSTSVADVGDRIVPAGTNAAQFAQDIFLRAAGKAGYEDTMVALSN